jgi:hypothetical protein
LLHFFLCRGHSFGEGLFGFCAPLGQPLTQFINRLSLDEHKVAIELLASFGCDIYGALNVDIEDADFPLGNYIPDCGFMSAVEVSMDLIVL